MSQLPSTSTRRPTSPIRALLGLIVCVAALQAPAAVAAMPKEESLAPFIIGGQESSISQFPWQVLVLSEFEENGKVMGGLCGGSILDPSHILTAAHCVDAEGTVTKHPPGDFLVVAGDSNLVAKSATAQQAGVASIRTHPYYATLPETKDDVAVLTLSKPLELSEAKAAEAIELVPAGATPAPGTALSLSGYGKQEGAEGSKPNGRLYSTSLTAISSDACRGAVGINSAVLLCAVGASSSACQGDSGGPLIEDSPALEVGIVDFGAKGCPVGVPNAFTNVAAPEVRAFIEGSETPPVAARPTAPPVIRAVRVAPVDYSPLTCEPGAWSGSPSFTYTFQTEDASPQVLQSGPSNLYTPPSSLVGVALVCIVHASNPGGVTTFRTATTPPIAADVSPPVGSITAVRCHLRACTLSIAASDPNSLALGVQPWVSYSVTSSCHVRTKKKKKKGKGSARPAVCRRTATVRLPISPSSAGGYRATATGLPYNESLTFIAVVTNAAGLHPSRLPTRPLTLHPPSKNHKPKSRHRKH